MQVFKSRFFHLLSCFILVLLSGAFAGYINSWNYTHLPIPNKPVAVWWAAMGAMAATIGVFVLVAKVSNDISIPYCIGIAFIFGYAGPSVVESSIKSFTGNEAYENAKKSINFDFNNLKQQLADEKLRWENPDPALRIKNQEKARKEDAIKAKELALLSMRLGQFTHNPDEQLQLHAYAFEFSNYIIAYAEFKPEDALELIEDLQPQAKEYRFNLTSEHLEEYRKKIRSEVDLLIKHRQENRKALRETQNLLAAAQANAQPKNKEDLETTTANQPSQDEQVFGWIRLASSNDKGKSWQNFLLDPANETTKSYQELWEEKLQNKGRRDSKGKRDITGMGKMSNIEKSYLYIIDYTLSGQPLSTYNKTRQLVTTTQVSVRVGPAIPKESKNNPLLFQQRAGYFEKGVLVQPNESKLVKTDSVWQIWLKVELNKQDIKPNLYQDPKDTSLATK